MLRQTQIASIRKLLSAMRFVVVAFLVLTANSVHSQRLHAAPPVAEAKQLSRAFQQVAESASAGIVSLEVRVKPGVGWTWWQGTFGPGGPSADPNRGRSGEALRRAPWNETGRPTHVGSGILIAPKGTVLTAFHVVEHADDIHVRTSNGHEYEVTEILTDPQSDIALLRIPAADDMPALKFGNSDKLEVGEWVLAAGDPYNTGVVVTPGIIATSGKGPSVLEHSDFLQTTAVINLGNSGGPLLNLDGEVVGVNTLFQHPSPEYAGIHFAVPINTVKWVSQQLLDHGKVLRAYIGVNVRDIDFRAARQYRVAPWSGVVVSAIHPRSPAADAGLREGDILLEFDGHRLTNARGLQRHVERTELGKPVKIQVQRDAQRFEVILKVREHDDHGPQTPKPVTKPK